MEKQIIKHWDNEHEVRHREKYEPMDRLVEKHEESEITKCILPWSLPVTLFQHLKKDQVTESVVKQFDSDKHNYLSDCQFNELNPNCII